MVFSPDSQACARAPITAEYAAIDALLATDDSGSNGDDAAVVTVDQTTSICVTIDTAVSGIHLHDDLSSLECGYRAAACALSDLAAMGAAPTTVVCAICVPSGRFGDVEAIVEGVRKRCRESGTQLVGGDLVSAAAGDTDAPLVISVTCIGQLGPAKRFVRRGGALASHDVYVTGTLGASEGARRLRDMNGDTTHWPSYTSPPNRIGAGQIIARHASAMLDLSDGLATDAMHIAAASGVGLAINLDLLPLADAAVAAADVLQEDPAILAATAGDDYELLFTCARTAVDALRAQLDSADFTELSLTRIGTCADTKVTFHRKGSAVTDLVGYEHGQARHDTG